MNLIEDNEDFYPNEYLYLNYWKITMAAREENSDLAMDFLDKLIEEGLWISQFLLRSSPSLENLQDLVEYEPRVAAMAELERRERSQLLPLLTLHAESQCLEEKDPCPLLIGLHVDRNIALSSIPFWRDAATKGWLVGVPQSSQALWSGAYVWEDRDTAQHEIETHARELQKKYAVNRRKVVLGGHGAGGELAAWLPMAGGIDAVGFVAINPKGAWIDNENHFIRLLQLRFPENIRGAILVGAQDPELNLEQLQKLVDTFNMLDVPCQLKVLDGVGTEYSKAYDPAIQAALKFILGNSA
jgi:hypothetical protein